VVDVSPHVGQLLRLKMGVRAKAARGVLPGPETPMHARESRVCPSTLDGSTMCTVDDSARLIVAGLMLERGMNG
jgi:hypothetical protein